MVLPPAVVSESHLPPGNSKSACSAEAGLSGRIVFWDLWSSEKRCR